MLTSSPREYLKQLFFVKRLPKLRNVPLYYKKPPTDTDYHKEVEWEGFISKVHWKDDDLSKYPVLQQDLDDLDEHLMPAFWEFNQKAKYFQNSFYLYQWIFMLGAFLTTLFGAFTTYSYTLESNGGSIPVILGIGTAILSGLLTFFNVLSEQSSPQKRWANTRRLSEELRTTYYKYISHLEPFDKEDRVQQLRQTVLAVRRKENENV